MMILENFLRRRWSLEFTFSFLFISSLSFQPLALVRSDFPLFFLHVYCAYRKYLLSEYTTFCVTDFSTSVWENIINNIFWMNKREKKKYFLAAIQRIVIKKKVFSTAVDIWLYVAISLQMFTIFVYLLFLLFLEKKAPPQIVYYWIVIYNQNRNCLTSR